LSARITTVRGDIAPEAAGRTLTHEHLVWDATCWAHPAPRELGLAEQVRQPVRLDNRGHVIYHNFYYLDNLVQMDAAVAVEEARKFRLAGGSTICDVTNVGIGRDPRVLYRVAVETGLNIVMGAGRYVEGSWSLEDKAKSLEELKREIVAEFRDGVSAGSGAAAGSLPQRVRPGILGEIGVSDLARPLEVKNLTASAMAQKELGCPMLIHTPIWEKQGNRILDILTEAGADARKVALSHLDPTMEDFDYADSLAKRGACIVYDQFGMELMTYEGTFLPSDEMRIRTVLEQIRRGNLEHILLSHDVAFKICLTRWGGFGYAHILENIVPRLRQKGLSQEQIDTILIENPKRFLAW
jgi:phosphotriesterase-related protein